MKNEIREYWVQLLDEIYDNVETFRNFIEIPSENYWHNFEYEWCGEIYDKVIKDEINFSAYDDIYLASGATKGVIVSYDGDFVLKVPFLATRKRNHCALECKVYEDACANGYEKIFAECRLLVEYKGLPFYIMEKVDCEEDEVSNDLSNKLLEEGSMDEEEVEDYVCDMDGSEIVEDLMRYYWDDNYFSDVLNFLVERQVGDLHCGNVGYRGDKLVFVDYSGYFPEEVNE